MIEAFATQHRLKITKDVSDGDLPIIAGRLDACHIYEYSDTELGVMFCTDGKKAPRTGLYRTFQKACLSVGMTQVQSGDAEGAFTFDPKNAAQAKAAIKGVKARGKRIMTAEQLAHLAQIGKKATVASDSRVF